MTEAPGRGRPAGGSRELELSVLRATCASASASATGSLSVRNVAAAELPTTDRPGLRAVPVRARPFYRRFNTDTGSIDSAPRAGTYAAMAPQIATSASTAT